MATGYGLEGQSSVLGRGKRIFSLLHSVQTGPGAHADSNPMGTGELSPGVKRPRREADHSPPSNVEVKNSGAIPQLPPHIFMAWRLID
jgi:hypothetical protein